MEARAGKDLVQININAVPDGEALANLGRGQRLNETEVGNGQVDEPVAVGADGARRLLMQLVDFHTDKATDEGRRRSDRRDDSPSDLLSDGEQEGGRGAKASLSGRVQRIA